MNLPVRLPPSPQRRASDPKASVWVSANAGSGKTHVLVDRVIRLMLAGTEPSRILCLTFTKAAAAEMNRRLFDRLGEWVALGNDQLDELLAKIEADPVTPEMRARARKLFTLALETPGGLKIQTIHAFSERLLQLFPVEAGVIPGFEIMDERTAAEMLKAARHAVIAQAEREPDGEVGKALHTVVALAQAEKFDKLIGEVLSKRSELGPLLADRRALASAMAGLKQLFGLGQDEDRDQLIADLIDIDHPLYGELIEILERQPSTKTDRNSADTLRRILAAGPSCEPLLRESFLTKVNKCRKPSEFMSNKLRVADSSTALKFDAEQMRVLEQFGKIAADEMITATECLLILAARIVAGYEQAKRQRGAYDFEDLIHRTRALLRHEPSAAWVLYKLDGGIDHILVDEAQDTSPDQWDIIAALAEDFFAGMGARPDTTRTIFVVGDRKQSIFSFQGADPDAFDRSRRHFDARIIEPERLRAIELTVSHRSTEDVLSAVDAVFKDPIARRGLNASLDEDFAHATVRSGHAGLVELWPVAGKPEREEHEPWILPVDSLRRDHPSLTLARNIALKIRSWLDQKRIIESRGRSVRPDDILILVRTRNRFFDSIIRELHHLSIPVAGADRVKLGEHIAIQDLLALAHFALLPEDDYSLACVLKSPLIEHPEGSNFSDEDLFTIAEGRGAKSLWQRLCAVPALVPVRATLERWSSLARRTTPFEFFAVILEEGRPSSRQRILGRLGSEAGDLLDALLDLALDYEHSHAPTLHGFLTWFAAAETEIKRDMDQGAGEVRVMTVHGAKGLEANIVILPDTCAVPDGRTEASLLMAPDSSGGALPLWRLSGRVEPAALAQWRGEERDRVLEEYRRQLYVAMTRARDELYVGGYTMLDAPNSGCWYEIVRRGLLGHPRCVAGEDGVLRITSKQAEPAEDKSDSGADRVDSLAVPDWATAAVAAPPQPAEWRAPSRLVRPGADTRAAFRGRAIHKLFQLLPDLPATAREAAGRRLLKRHGFPSDEAENMAKAMLALVADPRFAPFFAPASLAEVPFAVDLGEPLGPISGQIDRLVITQEEVFILDFKTDRRPPETASSVNPAYVAQLAAYRASLARIFPGRPVRAALLWTETPMLMELPAALMEGAFSAYHNPVPRP